MPCVVFQQWWVLVFGCLCLGGCRLLFCICIHLGRGFGGGWACLGQGVVLWTRKVLSLLCRGLWRTWWVHGTSSVTLQWWWGWPFVAGGTFIHAGGSVHVPAFLSECGGSSSVAVCITVLAVEVVASVWVLQLLMWVADVDGRGVVALMGDWGLC